MFILIIAALVTVVDFAMNACLHDLYLVLGIFIPLIVTNCIVLARVEAFAAMNAAVAAALEGAMMGLGLTLVLVTLGAVREFVGQGTLFSGIEMIVPSAKAWQVLSDDYPGFLVVILPPGAFFVLGPVRGAAGFGYGTGLPGRAGRRPSRYPRNAASTSPAPPDPAPSLH